ncbi:MAG: sensor domain-containing diguanylate cyclase [Nitrospirae bacterium]|nr:sensor domain-containing diguanylate cyclase [Nitrospirota bacterium]
MKKEIFIYEEDKDTLRFLRSFFRGRDDYSAHFIKRDEKALRRELVEKRPAAVIVNSPDGLEHINPSEVECPVIAMISGNVTNGIRSVVKAGVEYYLLSPFYKEDLEYKLKVAIERKIWFENLYREKKDLEALIELTYLVSSTLNPKEVLYLVVKKIPEIINVTRCSMISMGVEEQRYAYVVSTFEDPKITNIRLDLQKYPEIRKALTLKKPVIIKDAMKDPIMKEVRDIIAPIGIRSIVVIPMVFRDEIIGTLFLRTSRAGHTFTEREIKLCTAIANASANALYNAFLYDRVEKEKTRLERLAITDYLTGIYNIRYFYNRIDEEFSRAGRYNIPLGCMMFDIDYFKKINDTYGHRVGDIVLREFAQLVKRHTRKPDILARYGGEEFIMLLPETSMKGAIAEAKRLRKVIKEHQFKSLKEKREITVSIGIACSPDEKIKSCDDLITLTDDALFTAKNRGRDQIVVYPPLEESEK